MKSPWKLLSQLIPQRRSSAQRESSGGEEANTERSQSKANQLSGSTLGATDLFQRSAHGEDLPIERETTPLANCGERGVDGTPELAEDDDVKRLHTPAGRQPAWPTVRARPLETGTVSIKEPSRKSSRRKQKHNKRIRTDKFADSDDIACEAKRAQARSSRDNFFAELSSLDDAIKQLRIQLAQKLHLQNDQLKKMLARFDAS